MEMVERKKCAINKLREQKNDLYGRIADLERVKKKIENHIRKMDDFLYDYCDHEWEYYRESSYDQSDHLCKICGRFQSEWTKR